MAWSGPPVLSERVVNDLSSTRRERIGSVLAIAWLAIVLLGFVHARLLSSSTFQRLWERLVH
jgi:hypothetical protein